MRGMREEVYTGLQRIRIMYERRERTPAEMPGLRKKDMVQKSADERRLTLM